MAHILVTRSIIAGSALAEVVAEAYDLGKVTSCKLFSKMLRSQDNDHYKVRAGGQIYVLRLYQHGEHLDRKESDYLYELEWLNFLKNSDVRVSTPITRRDGRFIGHVEAPEGRRYYALFTYAPGKPMSAGSEDQLYILGRKMAQLHLYSNSFSTQQSRRPMDLDHLVDQPVDQLMRYWGDQADKKLDILLTSAAEAKAEIERLTGNPDVTEDSWGPIGGDFHPDNTHFDEHNEPTFFNFDLCGYGWRAYDIAVFLLNANLMQKPAELSEAFFSGYYSVRQLSQNEHQAISPLMTIRRVWLSGTFSMIEGVAGYTFLAPARSEV